MKELKTLLVVLVFVAITYIGVEPYAHSIMHPNVSPVNYDFSINDKESTQKAITLAEDALKMPQSNPDVEEKLKNALKLAQSKFEAYDEFWKEIKAIDLSKGDATNGEMIFGSNCIACHSMTSKGFPNPMGDAKTASESMGVAAPDLSSAGALYTPEFLAAIISNPVLAMKIDHKFDHTYGAGVGGFFPMMAYMPMENKAKEISDIVAFLVANAPKNLSDKEVFENACDRCHDLKYAKIYTQGNKSSVANYLGTTPPDLSQMIRSKNAKYLHEFMNDPQKLLAGTSMPRVGLNAKSQEQIVSYLEKVGDSKKEEREQTSINIMIYFAILSIFAYLFKRKIWRDLH